MPTWWFPAARRRAGIKTADRLEFKVAGGAINIVRKAAAAENKYTPRQRRAVDLALAEGIDDISKGRLRGPFDTHEAMIEFLHRQTSSAQRKSRRQPKG